VAGRVDGRAGRVVVADGSEEGREGERGGERVAVADRAADAGVRVARGDRLGQAQGRRLGGVRGLGRGVAGDRAGVEGAVAGGVVGDRARVEVGLGDGVARGEGPRLGSLELAAAVGVAGRVDGRAGRVVVAD